MKKQQIIWVFMIAAGFMFGCSGAGSDAETGDASAATEKSMTYEVNAAESELKWEGSKIGGTHNGTIDIASGTLSAEGELVTAGEFTIDMQSITNLDIEDTTYKNKLVGHLHSPDFFSTDSFPTAEFVVTSVDSAEGEHMYQVTGNLTIKGNTNGITFPAKIWTEGEQLNAEAQFGIDRSRWDIRYGSKTFFEDIGDKVINDEIKLDLKLVASKSGEASPEASAAETEE